MAQSKVVGSDVSRLFAVGFERRLIIHSPLRFKIVVMLAVALTAVLSACTGSDTQNGPEASSAPTGLTAPQLGPTSTSKPATPTPDPAPPTATIRPLDPVTAQDWLRGPDDADYSFLVYCDFQSPPCADLAQALEALRTIRHGEIQVIYRQFPLLVLNDKAGLAAQLALSADNQDAFWPMHDLLYDQQDVWSTLSPQDFLTWSEEAAADLGLDGDQVAADLRAGVYAGMVEEGFRQGVNSGLPGTPFLLLNGEWFRASPTLKNLEAAIRLEQLAGRQYEQRPELELDPDTLYLAHIKMTGGELVVQLFPESAPAAVANFIFLARQGWFDGTLFHRVVPGSYVEGGDPSATGFGGPGYFIRDEIDPAVSFDRPGRLAMANAGPDTNGSRFAITLRSMPEWDGARPILGQVIEGLSLLSGLEARDPLEDLLLEPADRIITVEIEEQ
ncbi:MAG: peptidylprolyl isomerase [Anaerolineales bacterium]|nr:peptidylprolyl isomerase [Anaerolineales bacterium]